MPVSSESPPPRWVHLRNSSRSRPTWRSLCEPSGKFNNTLQRNMVEEPIPRKDIFNLKWAGTGAPPCFTEDARPLLANRQLQDGRLLLSVPGNYRKQLRWAPPRETGLAHPTENHRDKQNRKYLWDHSPKEIPLQCCQCLMIPQGGASLLMVCKVHFNADNDV